ncbi:hypothetical protein ACQFYA_13720 [Promicromonospora sp. Marseille-Q5078]
MQTLKAPTAPPARRPPTTVRLSTVLWAVAVGSGVAETLLVVVPLTAAGEMDAGLWANVAVRAVVYAVAALLVVALARRRRLARVALAVLLSGVGLAAMVVPAVVALTQGDAFLDAVGSGGELAPAFAAVRLVHVAAVVAATVAMFLPSADGWFRQVPLRRRTDPTAG